MNSYLRKFAGVSALFAASSLAVPVQAAPITVPGAAPVAGTWDIDDETVNGWGHDRRWRRHRHGGDVLAGILIFGGAIAVASAIGNAKEREYRDRDARYRDYRDYPDYRDRDRGADYAEDRYRRDDAARRGIDVAIEDCVDEVQRDERVATVDTAERDGSGWQVGGELARGGRFECSLGADGRVKDIDIDIARRSSQETRDYGEVADRGRYDDDYYASARSRLEDRGPVAERGSAAEDDDNLWERGEADDRYETAKGPDYALVQ